MVIVKEVVSVSIGSSKRDHTVEIDLKGERFLIRREGTDGDMDRAVARVRELDGRVACFGLGGLDLWMTAAGRTYHFRDGRRFAKAAVKTPIVGGGGLKGAVEADTIRMMREDLGLEFAGKKTLVTSAVDRWGLAMALDDAGCEMTYGDLIFALDVPVVIHSRRALERLIHVIMPLAVLLPFQWLYPSSSDHTSEIETSTRHTRLIAEAEIIAGDYKFVRKYMPSDMSGKWIVTNTTTAEDVEFMRGRGVELLVTTTPRLQGRTFGTNVIEATMIALEGADRALEPERYLELLRETGFTPDVQWLQRG